jgi:hypothetical protein
MTRSILLFCALGISALLARPASLRAQGLQRDSTYAPITRPVGAVDLKRCEPLHRLMTETLQMVAEITPDTVDEWRTRKILPGCRVTAVGSMHREVVGEENNVFYAALLADGWTRTPDPYDLAGEAAVRMRYQDTDCFFTPYEGIRLGTEAEFRVNNAFVTRPGENRFSYMAQCVEAMPAAPR